MALKTSITASADEKRAGATCAPALLDQTSIAPLAEVRSLLLDLVPNRVGNDACDDAENDDDNRAFHCVSPTAA
ncbi:MAG: hypothetical protein ABJE99_08580 [Roseobacter sp.]